MSAEDVEGGKFQTIFNPYQTPPCNASFKYFPCTKIKMFKVVKKFPMILIIQNSIFGQSIINLSAQVLLGYLVNI
jgi:hypothetical protein